MGRNLSALRELSEVRSLYACQLAAVCLRKPAFQSGCTSALRNPAGLAGARAQSRHGKDGVPRPAMSDAAVAAARQRLAAMRGSLEGLRKHQARAAPARPPGCSFWGRGGSKVKSRQARLEVVCQQAREPWPCIVPVAVASSLLGPTQIQILAPTWTQEKETTLKKQLEDLLVEAEKASLQNPTGRLKHRRGCRRGQAEKRGHRKLVLL